MEELTNTEIQIVDNCKVWGFGAYLAWAWLVYPGFLKDITIEGKYPTREELAYAIKRMGEQSNNFDFIYLFFLPTFPENPLQVEQRAWKLLSLLIKKHINEFKSFIEKYSSESQQKEQLLALLYEGWGLLKRWNLISRSYKVKYDGVWNELGVKELTLEKLIQQLLSHQHK